MCQIKVEKNLVQKKDVQHCTTRTIGYLDKPPLASHGTKPEVLTAGMILEADLFVDLISAIKVRKPLVT